MRKYGLLFFGLILLFTAACSGGSRQAAEAPAAAPQMSREEAQIELVSVLLGVVEDIGKHAEILDRYDSSPEQWTEPVRPEDATFISGYQGKLDEDFDAFIEDLSSMHRPRRMFETALERYLENQKDLQALMKLPAHGPGEVMEMKARREECNLLVEICQRLGENYMQK